MKIPGPNSFNTLSALAILATTTSLTAETTLFEDDFSGGSGTPLADTTPDTTRKNQSWRGSNQWVLDGESGVTIADRAFSTVYLAFTPQPGHVYRLEVSGIDFAEGDRGNGFALGFIGADGATIDANGAPANWFTSQGAAPWVNVRPPLSGDNARLSSADNQFARGVSSPSTPASITLELDTTGTDWVARAYADGSASPFDSVTYEGPVADIDGCGIAINGSVANTSDLTLDQITLTRSR